MHKNKLIITFAAIGIFIFCPAYAWKHDQGSHYVPQEVQNWFKDGTCGHRDGEAFCDFTDPATAEKWAKSLEGQVEFWKEQAGQPTAILTKVCRDHGFVDEDCPKILYAMAEQESYMGKVMVGDGGRAHGYFQINNTWHDVPRACTDDLACSANWTLERMIRLGFSTNRDIAIQKHNGTPGIPATIKYLAAVKSKMKLF